MFTYTFLPLHLYSRYALSFFFSLFFFPFFVSDYRLLLSEQKSHCVFIHGGFVLLCRPTYLQAGFDTFFLALNTANLSATFLPVQSSARKHSRCDTRKTSRVHHDMSWCWWSCMRAVVLCAAGRESVSITLLQRQQKQASPCPWRIRGTTRSLESTEKENPSHDLLPSHHTQRSPVDY